MSRTSTSATLTVVGLAALAVWLVAPIRPLSVAGFTVGVVALAAAVGISVRRSTPLTFRAAVGAAFLPAVVVLGLVSGFSPERVAGWFPVALFVFVFGTGLAYPLGVARTARQRWLVVAALAALGELLVAAAVFDWNTALEMEGTATALAVLVLPVFVLVGVGLYVLGARRHRAAAPDSRPETRPLVTAVALPWVGGVAALVVPKLFESGLAGLQYTVLVGGRVVGVPVPSPLLLVFLAVGGAAVYTVHRQAGHDGPTAVESR